jgi:tRNA pseudouridine55 synthase
MVLLLGPAVRLMDQVHAFDKEYIGEFRFGFSSASGDLETECIQVESATALERLPLLSTLERFLGSIQQTPPAYSAIRIDGKRAHAHARRGIQVEIPKRSVEIHELELLDLNSTTFTIRTVCSTGTYMRTLGSDIAKHLGSDAVMVDLKRTRVGPFRLDQAIRYDQLKPIPWEPFILSPSLAVSNLLTLCVDDVLMRKVLDGKKLPWQTILKHCISQANPNNVPNISASDTTVALLDDQLVLRAILKEIAPDQWRCDKGIAHWDVLPKRPE